MNESPSCSTVVGSIVFGIFLAGHGRIDPKDPGFLGVT
jgi:hypothetical protein